MHQVAADTADGSGGVVAGGDGAAGGFDGSDSGLRGARDDDVDRDS